MTVRGFEESLFMALVASTGNDKLLQRCRRIYNNEGLGGYEDYLYNMCLIETGHTNPLQDDDDEWHKRASKLTSQPQVAPLDYMVDGIHRKPCLIYRCPRCCKT